MQEKNNNENLVKLSDNAVNFIKKYVISELHITTKIDDNIFSEILYSSTLWEENMIDFDSKDGFDKTHNYPEKERNEMADKFNSEMSTIWSNNKYDVDLDDLNKRLGLK